MFKSLSFLWKFAWREDKLYIICLILNQIFSAVTPILLMIFPKVILEELMSKNRLDVLVFIILVFSLGIFISQMLSSFLTNTAFYRRCIVLEKFQVNLNEHLAKVDYENLENPEFLNLKQNAEKFLYANGQGFSFVLDRAVNIVGKIIIFMTIIWIIASLNIFVLIAFLCLSALNSFMQMKYKKTYASIEIEKNPKERELAYYNSVFSNVEYAKEIRINGDKGLFLQHLKNCLHNLWIFYKRQMNLLNQSKFSLYIVDFLQRAISYLYMIFMVSTGNISIANFMMYINAISTFTDSMNNVIDSINDIRQYSLYFESVEKYLNLPINIDTKAKEVEMPETIETIEFKNVSFRYKGSSKWALKNISCVFTGKEKISIVGENGAGKTTFIKLLCRLYDPSEGVILLNGVDIKRYNYRQYIEKISAVFQDFKLFSIQLDENIALKQQVDDEKAKHILSNLGIWDIILKLPYKLKNKVHKDFDLQGFEPSDGVGQKLAIARALYKNTPLIILDEPTAALDPRAEYEIYQSFEALTENRMAFYISHRLSSSRFCDQILVFKDGKIVEQGNHNQLMELKNYYFELYEMQSKYYVEK